MKKPKRETKLQRYKTALENIANSGRGLKPEIIDWQNIGKNSVFRAKEALAEKCPRCGK